MQVWYHVCANRGRGCYNTRLKEDGGCTIWYNEKEVNRFRRQFKLFWLQVKFAVLKRATDSTEGFVIRLINSRCFVILAGMAPLGYEGVSTKLMHTHPSVALGT